MAGEYMVFNNNSQPALNDVNVNRLQQLIKQDIQNSVSGDTLPVGAIMPFGSDIIPSNWLLCDGRAINREDYQELFNTIGTNFGSGDGFTTFNLPDLRKRVPVGKDENDTDFDTLGETGGEKTHTLTIDEMPEHYHRNPLASPDDSNFSGGENQLVAADSDTSRATGHNSYPTTSKGGNQAHNNLQPYIVQNYIIKTKQSAGIIATVVDSLSSTSATDGLSANQGRILNNKIYVQSAQGTNIDNLRENGKYGILNATGTLPSGYSSSDNNIIIECIMWTNTYGKQILHDIRSDETYIRRLENGAWHSWKQISIY